MIILQKIVTDFGEISLVLDRYADTKTILTVDLGEVQIAELRGTFYEDLPKAGDYFKGHVLNESTIKLLNSHAGSKVCNFSTSGLGNGSGIDPNAGVDGKCSVSYRGEENLWGNIWTWLDAINIYNDKASGVYNAFVKPYGECKDDTTADGYKALDFNIATGEGYISGFGYDEDHPDLFLCAEHNGASNLPVGDYYWNNNDGFRVARLGGWNGGAGCGAWCLDLSSASSVRGRAVGGRLLYVPQTKISA